jgi:hypothetical protein
VMNLLQRTFPESLGSRSGSFSRLIECESHIKSFVVVQSQFWVVLEGISLSSRPFSHSDLKRVIFFISHRRVPSRSAVQLTTLGFFDKKVLERHSAFVHKTRFVMNFRVCPGGFR